MLVSRFCTLHLSLPSLCVAGQHHCAMLPSETPAGPSGSAATRLGQGEEFRFEVAPATTVRVILTSGTAEAFGAELAPAHPYSFCGTSGPTHVAIYSWHGCTLSVEGDPPRHSYVASADAFMTQVMHVHASLCHG